MNLHACECVCMNSCANGGGVKIFWTNVGGSNIFAGGVKNFMHLAELLAATVSSLHWSIVMALKFALMKF